MRYDLPHLAKASKVRGSYNNYENSGKDRDDGTQGSFDKKGYR